jgi:hypothetical protein
MPETRGVDLDVKKDLSGDNNSKLSEPHSEAKQLPSVDHPSDKQAPASNAEIAAPLPSDPAEKSLTDATVPHATSTKASTDTPVDLHASVQTATTAEASTEATTNKSLTAAARQHHLLKHVLNEEQRGNNALQHFGTSDVAEAVEKINGMVQRELQVHFAKVYGVRSNSNNNSWLRKKLLEGIYNLYIH